MLSASSVREGPGPVWEVGNAQEYGPAGAAAGAPVSGKASCGAGKDGRPGYKSGQQGLDDTKADAAARAGNKDHFILQAKIHRAYAVGSL